MNDTQESWKKYPPYVAFRELSRVRVLPWVGTSKSDNRTKGMAKLEKELDKYFPDKTKMWGIKQLMFHEIADIFLEVYPETKIVHVYRESSSRTFPDIDWLNKQEEFENLLIDKIGTSKYFKFDYDLAVANPKKVVGELATFIGVSLTKDASKWVKSFIKEEGVKYRKEFKWR